MGEYTHMSRAEVEALADRRYRMLEETQNRLRRLEDAVAAELGWPVWQRDWAPLRRLVKDG